MAKRLVDKAEKLEKLANAIDVDEAGNVDFGANVSVDGTLHFNSLPLLYESNLPWDSDTSSYILNNSSYNISRGSICILVVDNQYTFIAAKLGAFSTNPFYDSSGVTEIVYAVLTFSPASTIEPAHPDQVIMSFTDNEFNDIQLDGLDSINVKIYKLL